MEFTQFVRKPFAVEAVQITTENLEEVAKLIGTVRTKTDSGMKYIVLDRRIVPNVGRAYIGWWVTQFRDNYRCYAEKVFNEQFVPDPDYVLVPKEEESIESDPADPHGIERSTQIELEIKEPINAEDVV